MIRKDTFDKALTRLHWTIGHNQTSISTYMKYYFPLYNIFVSDYDLREMSNHLREKDITLHEMLTNEESLKFIRKHSTELDWSLNRNQTKLIVALEIYILNELSQLFQKEGLWEYDFRFISCYAQDNKIAPKIQPSRVNGYNDIYSFSDSNLLYIGILKNIDIKNELFDYIQVKEDILFNFENSINKYCSEKDRARLYKFVEDFILTKA